ncbi:hypothetical protein BEP19_04150 [Ammoniphilus oxalaticus]|uniref:Lysine N-acyltransferase MbtK n=1 Tax=Ammoniphilus oxalaticus TaxID=66863 RepID=A0A419SLT2_9BACL|nr:GNAT family N-acetyltransferase [Ammoniphilus oxalaticus]RKD25027.1 hypothetical protein BEP19_04150 [Ammoniphilus oxalaticus]
MSSQNLFTFRVYDEMIHRKISFRVANLQQDTQRLHLWHQQSHLIPFWGQNFCFLKYRQHFQMLLADLHRALWIGYLDNEAMSYWETYCAQVDLIGEHYEVESGDRGIRVLFGPQKFLGKGYALPLLRAMIAFQFHRHSSANKIVTEPDIRNEREIQLFEQCGFEPQQEIVLPGKRALLMFCRRDSFFYRWRGIDYLQDLFKHEQQV